MVRGAGDESDLLNIVFVSHTGRDERAKGLASSLARELRAKRRNVFFDAEALQAGVVWKPRIQEMAKRCAVFVAVLSPSFPVRAWPLHELHLALQSASTKQYKSIVPVLFGVGREALEAPCASWQDTWGVLADTHPDLEMNPREDLKNLLDFQVLDGTYAAESNNNRALSVLQQHIVEVVERLL